MESKFSLIDMISKYKLTKTYQPASRPCEKMPNLQTTPTEEQQAGPTRAWLGLHHLYSK